MQTMREFPEAGLLAGAFLVGSKTLLQVSDNGYLQIPEGVKPTGFHLLVACDVQDQTLLVQKNVSEKGGAYDSSALSVPPLPKGFRGMIMSSPIQVLYEGENVRTAWHADTTNRMDSFHFDPVSGFFGLYQTGIFTHDDGLSFRLFGEWRWKGKLYKLGDGFVAVPESLRWGSFDGGSSKRNQIFDEPGFADLLSDAELEEWDGPADQVEPPLPKVTTEGHAVVDWFITFASRQGAGIAKLPDGSVAWVQAHDIAEGGLDREDGELQFHRGDEISYEKLDKNWGEKSRRRNGPPKLNGVRLVNRPYK